MRTTTSKFIIATGFALVAAISTLSFSGATSAAEGARKHTGGSVHTGSGGPNRAVGTPNANRGFGNREGNRVNHGPRRNHSFNNGVGNDNYRRHNRRNRGLGFGGISIDLGNINSSCRYSYRKWQATGSRYWRRQYYDCIG